MYNPMNKFIIDDVTPIINEKPELYKIKNNELVPRAVSEVKALLITKARNLIKKEMLRPKVDTGLGFSVDGGYQDLQNFKIGQDLNAPLVKDADGNFHEATPEMYNVIIGAIKTNGLALFSKKWSVEKDIEELTTFEELEQYYDNLKVNQ